MRLPTCCCLFLLLAASAAERPNILFIDTDDHSHRSIGCYPEAYDWVKTPNIDRLAEQAIGGASGWVSLRRGKYKYIRSLLEGEPEELDDLDADPSELTNLAQQAGYGETPAMFRDSMIAELQRTGAKIGDDLPPTSSSP